VPRACYTCRPLADTLAVVVCYRCRLPVWLQPCCWWPPCSQHLLLPIPRRAPSALDHPLTGGRPAATATSSPAPVHLRDFLSLATRCPAARNAPWMAAALPAPAHVRDTTPPVKGSFRLHSCVWLAGALPAVRRHEALVTCVDSQSQPGWCRLECCMKYALVTNHLEVTATC
jgi:hypothetical protein